MKADSREEMQQWIDAIQKALQVSNTAIFIFHR